MLEVVLCTTRPDHKSTSRYGKQQTTNNKQLITAVCIYWQKLVRPMTGAGDRGISKLLAAAAQIDNMEVLEACPGVARLSCFFQVPIVHVQNVSVIRAQAVDRIIEGIPIAAAFEMPRCHARKSFTNRDDYQCRMLHPVSYSLDNQCNLNVRARLV